MYIVVYISFVLSQQPTSSMLLRSTTKQSAKPILWKTPLQIMSVCIIQLWQSLVFTRMNVWCIKCTVAICTYALLM